jgi:hypothetical protein
MYNFIHIFCKNYISESKLEIVFCLLLVSFDDFAKDVPGEFPSQTDLSSCGAMVCLYAKLITERTHLKESHVIPLQIRQYILSEVIKTYQKQTEDNLQFGLRNIIFTKDMDEIIHTIVTGRRLCNEPHNSFLKNPMRMKRKDLIGFGDNYLTQDKFYSIQLYLKDTYCPKYPSGSWHPILAP